MRAHTGSPAWVIINTRCAPKSCARLVLTQVSNGSAQTCANGSCARFGIFNIFYTFVTSQAFYAPGVRNPCAQPSLISHKSRAGVQIRLKTRLGKNNRNKYFLQAPWDALGGNFRLKGVAISLKSCLVDVVMLFRTRSRPLPCSKIDRDILKTGVLLSPNETKAAM